MLSPYRRKQQLLHSTGMVCLEAGLDAQSLRRKQRLFDAIGMVCLEAGLDAQSLQM